MYVEGNHLQQNTNEHAARASQQAPVHCANCDIEILWPPVVVRGFAYCCTGCAAGGPCNCDYSQYRSANIGGVIRYGADASREDTARSWSDKKPAQE